MSDRLNRGRLSFEGVTSLTKKSFKRDCDINFIMKKYKQIYGEDFVKYLPSVTGGHFGDFSEIPDYRTAIENVRMAQESFMKIPAEIRRRFNDDPAVFLEYAQNPSNFDDLCAMGLAHKPQENVEPSGETV